MILFTYWNHYGGSTVKQFDKIIAAHANASNLLWLNGTVRPDLSGISCDSLRTRCKNRMFNTGCNLGLAT